MIDKSGGFGFRFFVALKTCGPVSTSARPHVFVTDYQSFKEIRRLIKNKAQYTAPCIFFLGGRTSTKKTEAIQLPSMLVKQP